MLRFWLHGTALSALIFCALLGAMRAQPYNDGGLRMGLYAPDCTPPLPDHSRYLVSNRDMIVLPGDCR